MVSDPLYTFVKRSQLWLYQKPAQVSVALQAIPQAILLSTMDSFVIRVLAPTCCNSYFEYVKFANDDREKNTIRNTSLGVIFTTELSHLYNSSSNYMYIAHFCKNASRTGSKTNFLSRNYQEFDA